MVATTNQTLIKEQWIDNLSEVIIKIDIVEKIKITREKYKKVIRVVKKMKKTRVKVLWGDEWQIEGDLVLKEGKIYIPKNKELRVEIIRLYYNVLVVGHGGR